ncbi:hypothetical protein [Desulfotruncus alcoholivorax]|uniref:hypothetical protein n=1 Tax=Desulfotruncus alcoholivorax TaxID=265477 RepID=UPI000410F573|nr:hypothetical protein [Desulfotruncus alcoholivorax]
MTDQSKAIIFGLLMDKPVAYHPDVAKMLKSVTACVFLAQLLYWTGRGNDEWIYKTQSEWYEETGLSRKEQETARKKLVEKGILHEQRRGQPARLYYRLDLERLAECLSEYYRKFKNSDPNGPNSPNMEDESEHSSMPERGNLECTNRANKIAPKSHTIYTENTTENTTDTVVVEGTTVEKCREDSIPESSPAGEPDNNIKELQQQAEKACGVKIPTVLLRKLVDEYGREKVKEKIQMLGSVQTRNAPGFLIAALRDDYVLLPGQPQQQPKRASPGGQAGRKKAQTRGPDSPEAERKIELIKSLYMN